MEYFADCIEKKYIKYRKKLVFNCKPLLGVSTGNIRKVAKKLVESNDLSFFEKKSIYHEEDLLKAYGIGYFKDYDQMLKFLDKFLINVSNWETCDYLVGNLCITKKHLDEMKNYIRNKKWLKKEFTCRFVFVMLKTYFVRKEELDFVFELLDKDIDLAFYYAKMAKAWLISECGVKYFNETIAYLSSSKIDDWSYNKGINKMLESFRVSSQNKETLRKIRRK